MLVFLTEVLCWVSSGREGRWKILKTGLITGRSSFRNEHQSLKNVPARRDSEVGVMLASSVGLAEMLRPFHWEDSGN